MSDPEVRAEVVRQLCEAAGAEKIHTGQRANELGLPLVIGDGAVLAGFEGDVPLYDRHDNERAAISTGADLIRNTAPFGIDGAGYQIGLWESGGLPRLTHQEIAGRVTHDDIDSVTSHSTHVAGTLIAAGISPSLEGMAPAASVIAHNSSSEVSEMTQLAAAAPGEAGKIYVSNHSYGTFAGWSTNPWRWWGTFSYEVQWSGDLVSWHPLAGSVESVTGSVETVKSRVLMDGVRKFMRLSIARVE